jgi:hypothetical protein
MAVAPRAADFDPAHAMAGIGMLDDRAAGRRLGEARPTAAAVEFGVALEQLLAAGRRSDIRPAPCCRRSAR